MVWEEQPHRLDTLTSIITTTQTTPNAKEHLMMDVRALVRMTSTARTSDPTKPATVKEVTVAPLNSCGRIKEPLDTGRRDAARGCFDIILCHERCR